MLIDKLKIKPVQSYFWGLVCLCVCAFSCTQRNRKPQDAVSVPRTFSLPQIPPVLSSPESRAAYLAEHYWENFDFRDTTQISKPEITEQALVDFLVVLPQVTHEKADRALITLMESSSADTAMFRHFIELTDKYLYDPNSPMRNEELYIPILRYLVASPKLDELEKIRPQYQLEMALKNRPGEIATDFTYTTESRSGVKTRHMLHNLRSEYTLLFFNNPDCADCFRTKEYIAASPVFVRWQQQGLTILALYPDADLEMWRKAIYPREWINGYDAAQMISEQQLYDLKAIPALYLLDRDKRVILKDAPVERVEQWATKEWQNKESKNGKTTQSDQMPAMR